MKWLDSFREAGDLRRHGVRGAKRERPRDARFREQMAIEFNAALTPVDEVAEGDGGRDQVTRPPQIANDDSKLFKGGEDTVILSFGIEWERFFALEAKLDYAKAVAAGEVDTEADPAVQFGGETWLVEAKGHRNKGGVYYPWHLARGGVRLAIAKASEPSGETRPNVTVHIGSHALMSAVSADEVVREVMETIEGEGGRILWDKLSRVDACLDMPGVRVEVLSELFRERRFISRARNATEFVAQVYSNGGQDTGFVIGSGIKLRVYDKLREAAKDPHKLACLIQQRWGGSQPEHATRAEFQLDRESLKTFGVSSWKDWLRLREAVVGNLCEKWIRFTASSVDRTHTTRATVHELWARVAESFRGWASSTVKEVARRFLWRIDAQALKRQALGCLLSTAAALAPIVDDAGELLAALSDAVLGAAESLGAGEVMRRARVKRQRVEALYATGYVSSTGLAWGGG